MKVSKVATSNLFYFCKASLRWALLLTPAFIICLLASQPVAAQLAGSMSVHLNDAGEQPGRSPFGDMVPPVAFSGSDRPDTASFVMSEPLVSLPGRGLDVNLNLNYDSSIYQKSWNHTNLYVESTVRYPQTPGYGFTLGYGMLVAHNVSSVCRIERVSGTGLCNGDPTLPLFSSAYTFIDSTGARHRIEGGITVDSSDLRYDGNITYPDGTRMIFGAGISVFVATQTGEAYLNYDGNSTCRKICDISDRIYFPTKIIDRNGNYIQITYLNGAGPRINTITDTLGRVITFHYSGDYPSSITVPDFTTGAEHVVARFYTSPGSRTENFIGQTHFSFPIQTLDYVYLPDTKVGWHYTYSSYGMVYLIEKLAGMESDPTTGALTSTGQVIASTQYKYPGAPDNLISNIPYEYLIYTKRTDRWMTPQGVLSDPLEHKYSVTLNTANHTSVTTITAPDDQTVTEITRVYYKAEEHVPENWRATWDEGLVLKQRVVQGNKLLLQLDNAWKKPSTQGGPAGPYDQTTTPGGPRLYEQTTTNDAGQQSKVVYGYCPDPVYSNYTYYGVFDNVCKKTEYKFNSSTVEVRRIESTYETNPSWTDRWLVKLLKSTKVFQDGATVPISQSDYAYDETSLASYPTLPASYQASTPSQRGNLTTITQNTNAASPSNGVTINTYMSYDVFGNLVSATDPEGKLTQTSYVDQFSTAQSNVTYAYPTSITSPIPDPTPDPAGPPHGSNSALTTSNVYNFYTGLTTMSSDANGQATTYEYNDPANRMTKVSKPDGGWTSYNYSDAPGNIYQHIQTALDGSRSVEAYQYFDARGRKTRAFTYDGSNANQNWVVTDTEYDVMGRPARNSNPYFVSAPGGTIEASSIKWTSSEYDGLGRTLTITASDGSKMQTAYDGERVLVTDQAGHQRLSKNDELGHLTDVWEIRAGNSETELVSFPEHAEVTAGYHTSYEYDVLGDLKKVSQGEQTRNFNYDSLKRMTSASNPESGVVNYEYDKCGNLKKKTDARQVQTEYYYDALNRIISRKYSVIGTTPPNYTATPQVNYFYDGTGMQVTSDYTIPTPMYAKGRLTAVKSSVSQSINAEFDQAGRVQTYWQVTAGAPQSYVMRYTYNLAGGMVTEQYPSGRIITTEYDRAGRVAGVRQDNTYYAGGAPDSTNSIQYAAQGSVSALRLGNGLWEHTNFNERLQPTEIGLGTQYGLSDKMKLSYTYDALDAGGQPLKQNNGNLLHQVINVPDAPGATGMTVTQHYRYDSLNRLSGAQEVSGNSPDWQSSSVWQQDFGYDRYGNRTSVATTVVSGQPGLSTLAPEITSGNNQFKKTNSNNQSTGYDYDQSGNLTQEPTASATIYNKYNYDGENHLVQGKHNAQEFASYTYDGDGRRVRKIENTNVTTIYVYNLSGQLVAEYGAPANDAGGTQYISADQLGSTRLVTDSGQAVVARYDSLPFGEQMPKTMNGRNADQRYGVQAVNQKFTGKEHDNETGFEYFGARYYASAQGRFTSPDNIAYSKSADPQTWNQYVYCRNGPLSRVDPDGHNWFFVYHKDGSVAWEWHNGKKGANGETWTDRATGKTYTSKFTNIIIINIITQANESRSHQATVTVYGKNWNDVVAQDLWAFSGAPLEANGCDGCTSGPPRSGEYFINLNKMGGIETNYTLNNGEGLASFRNGFQYVTPEWQGSWGTKRANLARAAWSNGQPYFDPKGSGTNVYLHGHKFSFASTEGNPHGAPYNYTLGCVGTPDENVLNWLSTAKSQGAYPVIPTSVHRNGQ
jgi:RHS repeat-associated protein